MSKKRKRVLWLVVLLLILVFVLNIVTGLWNKQDKEWGVSLNVYNVTPYGLSYELKCENSAYNKGKLVTDSTHRLEKRTFFYWPHMDWEGMYGPWDVAFTLEALVLDESIQRDVNWEGQYDKLPMGMYRIGKTVSVSDLYSYPKDDIVSGIK